tara:strand:+ start:1317 stop:2123 length:807 start_codon:yes stop_codon:yes gene_type:complete
MKVLLAGKTRTEKNLNFIEENKMMVLLSFLNNKREIEKWSGGKLMVDSGAHSWNKLTLQKVGHKARKNLPNPIEFYNSYVEFIKKYRQKDYVFVELDVYKVLPKENIDAYYKEIKKIEGNFEFIRVYHPTIDNGTLKVFKEWIDEGQTYIGIGNDSTPLLNNIFRLTKDKIKIHGFAMTKSNLIQKYPFYSCDSTTYKAMNIYGGYYDGKQMKFIGKKKLVKERSRKLLETANVLGIWETDLVGIKGMLALEKFGTKLWQKRGISWNE